MDDEEGWDLLPAAAPSAFDIARPVTLISSPHEGQITAS